MSHRVEVRSMAGGHLGVVVAAPPDRIPEDESRKIELPGHAPEERGAESHTDRDDPGRSRFATKLRKGISDVRLPTVAARLDVIAPRIAAAEIVEPHGRNSLGREVARELLEDEMRAHALDTDRRAQERREVVWSASRTVQNAVETLPRTEVERLDPFAARFRAANARSGHFPAVRSWSRPQGRPTSEASVADRGQHLERLVQHLESLEGDSEL